MSIGTKIYTWLKGNLVAEDEIGNKYYSDSKDFKDISSYKPSGNLIYNKDLFKNIEDKSKK